MANTLQTLGYRSKIESARGPKKQRKGRKKSIDTLPLDHHSLYINRELSWLEFNQRVLDQAHDEKHPLLERVKFLAITGTNLDEFFMIRVATILRQIKNGSERVTPDGLTPKE